MKWLFWNGCHEKTDPGFVDFFIEVKSSKCL